MVASPRTAAARATAAVLRTRRCSRAGSLVETSHDVGATLGVAGRTRSCLRSHHRVYATAATNRTRETVPNTASATSRSCTGETLPVQAQGRHRGERGRERALAAHEADPGRVLVEPRGHARQLVTEVRGQPARLGRGRRAAGHPEG